MCYDHYLGVKLVIDCLPIQPSITLVNWKFGCRSESHLKAVWCIRCVNKGKLSYYEQLCLLFWFYLVKGK